MGNLLLSNGLSLVFTTAALVCLYIGPRRWRLTPLWVYLTVIEGMTLGLVLFGPPTVTTAKALECIRATLAVGVGLHIAHTAGRAGGYQGREAWRECAFQAACFLGIAATLVSVSVVHGNHPASACYREIGLVDFGAAAVLLVVGWRMRAHLTRPVDEWAAYGLGAVYSLYAVYRLLRQFDEPLAQAFGWLGTMAYCATMIGVALAALDEWPDPEWPEQS